MFECNGEDGWLENKRGIKRGIAMSSKHVPVPYHVLDTSWRDDKFLTPRNLCRDDELMPFYALTHLTSFIWLVSSFNNKKFSGKNWVFYFNRFFDLLGTRTKSSKLFIIKRRSRDLQTSSKSWISFALRGRSGLVSERQASGSVELDEAWKQPLAHY